MTVTIQWDADTPLTAQPDAGSANKVYTETGPGTVTITDEAIGGASRTLNFTVPLDLTTVVPTPASVDSGGNLAARTLSVAGEGFPASTNGTLAIATGGPGAWGATLVAVGVTTNTAGIFTGASIVVPADTDAGAYHMEATFGDIADLDTALTITNTGLVAPTGLASPSQTATTVVLTWSSAVGAEEYAVRWAPASSGTWTERAPVAALTDTVTGLTASTSYDFQVKSMADGMTDSTWSASLTQSTAALPTLATPANPAAGTPTTTTIPFSWDAVTSAETYTVEWRINPAGAWTAITGIATTNTTVSGLDPNVTYDLRVKAVASGFADSAFSAVVTEATDPLGTLTTPATPTSSAQTTTSVTVNWTAVTNADTYVVRWSPAGAGTWTERAPVAALTDTVTGLTTATSYDFQVKAEADGWVDSAWSTSLTQSTS